MALADILRDTNNAHMLETISGDDTLCQEEALLDSKDTKELWSIYLGQGLVSAQGKAALNLLRRREPEHFRPDK